MPNTYYDHFLKLPKSRMAQAISDLTYLYEETKVPKRHYEQHLSKTIVEIMESSVELQLLNTFYSMLKDLQVQNPKWFFQAILCLDLKINPSTIKPSEHQAIEQVWNEFQAQTKPKIMDIEVLAQFQKFEKNGLRGE